jgi:hypothetical protein
MIPTVDDIIRRHSDIFPGWCDWPTDGGVISIRTSVLRPYLEAAYDPTCPDWPQFVELPEPDHDHPSLSAAERNPNLR